MAENSQENGGDYTPVGGPIFSSRGRPKLASDGYLYIFDRDAKDKKTKYWRCEQKNHCRARVHTLDDSVIRQVGLHSHDASAAAVEAQRALSSLKRRSILTADDVSQIINESIDGLSEAAQNMIPSPQTLRKIVLKKRKQTKKVPPLPFSLESLTIPEEYRLYQIGDNWKEDFLLYDSGPTNERILLFGRRQSLMILYDSQVWFADGTFHPVPPLFAQIYVLMAEKLGGVHPILYALLPDKKESTYDRLLQAICNIQPNLNPISITTDFEPAATRALQRRFPAARINSCLFQLCRQIKRQMDEVQLISRYSNDAEFALKCRMIAALAFVPIADLGQALVDLASDLPPLLKPLLTWFEDRFVGRKVDNGDGRHPATYPPDMWSVYEKVVYRQHRVDNYAEATHRRLQTALGVLKPKIWKFVDGIRAVQKESDSAYEQLVAGSAPSLKKKKSADFEQRIIRIVETYQNRRTVEYLRGLSHNFEMNF